jgi:uncharacterized delta-60 repeat protein
MLESRLGLWLLVTLGCWTIGLLATAPSVATPAELDSSFGQMGEVSIQTQAGCHPACPAFVGSDAQALALAPDGKLLIAGQNINSPTSYTEGAQSVLVRLNGDGTLDGTFGSGGFAQAPPFGLTRLYAQADGSLVVVGTEAIGIAGEIGVEHYTASGTEAGKVQWIAPPVLPQGPTITAGWPQLDSAGRIVVLAETIVPLAPLGSGPKLVRFLSTDALDEAFGSGGIASLPAPSRTETHPFGSDALALDDDGSMFVVAGTYLERHNNEERKAHIVLYHLKPDGRLDSSFGRGGMVALPDSSGYGTPALAVAPDGDIMLAAGEDVAGKPRRHRLLVLRYTKTGRPDSAFGHKGMVARTWVGHWVNSRRVPAESAIVPSTIAFDARGDTVITGTDYNQTPTTGTSGRRFLARLTQSGFDCSFGSGGMVFGSPRTSANAMVVQADGRILIAGEGDDEFTVARYMGGGAPRTCSGERKSRRSKHEHRRRERRRRR